MSYTLSEMADDAVRLLDAFGLDSAHVMGVSMGGMVAQILVVEHPSRVRTPTSIMSTTGDPCGRRRAFDPAGVARQLAAIFASGDRTPGLAKVTVPTLVIHGAQDPLISGSGGRATAAVVPGAEPS